MKSLVLFLMILAFAFWHYGVHFSVTILAISFLIFFHELGHFLVARFFGVRVNTFSVGFGEKIYTKRVGNTDYCLSAILLGGYVQLKGQDDLDPNAKNYDHDSYNVLSPIKRIAILFAGPFFNLLLAFFLYIAIGFMGVDKLAPNIGTVLPNSVALSAGLVKDDKILSINGVKINEWEDIKKQVSLSPLDLVVQRGDKTLNISLTPKIGESINIFREKVEVPLIGISPNGDITKVYHSGFSSLSYAFSQTVEASKLIYKGLEKLIIGTVPLKEMGGIVAMADITTKASQINLSVLFLIVALISVNLGVLNLLPLPVLDGGHIVFNLYEMIFRRLVNQRVFNALSYGSMMFLFALMAFTIFNDLLRLAGVYE
ncbi:RseP-like zinc metalloprotease [Campylobacter iguaniorum]|uniref:RIP metalloprotease RseP n=1 Tax=Campylobacter iguaniorum TaxID=1244531 RepID=UPI0007C99166|nr:RIP metalloprotease RseP [Campylobacter iguaniorum]ANE35879.1 RseP-like zinc metalloprotease [Campylobacter iguaniorum]